MAGSKNIQHDEHYRLMFGHRAMLKALFAHHIPAELGQGLEQGKVEAIAKLLQLRFGERPEREARLRQLSLPQLDAMLRILDAPTEEACFASS